MKSNFIIDAVIPLAIGISTSRDRWTICGRFKLGDEDNKPTILIYTKSIDSWKKHHLIHLKRSGSVEIKGQKIIVDITYAKKRYPISVLIIEPPTAFGLFEIMTCLPSNLANELKNILTNNRGIFTSETWPKYGFIFKGGGLYFKNSRGGQLSMAVPIPDAIPFIDFLVKNYKLKDELEVALIALNNGIKLFEKECKDVCFGN